MSAVTRLAPAKINLTLDVLGRRQDGYHELSSVFHEVGIYDEVTVERAEYLSIRTASHLPVDERNTAVRAAGLFFEETGIQSGARLTVDKHIPCEAGLGGGSSDAAAVLMGLNELFQAGLSEEKMCEIGLKIGADVPFFIQGGACLAEGIGEKLTPLPKLPPCHILLCKPQAGLSTRAVFAAFDAHRSASFVPKSGALAEALIKGDLRAIAMHIGNALEEICIGLLPAIGAIKRSLLEGGALGACMSGSGSTVFGLFDDEEKAGYCARLLAERHPFVRLV